MAGFLANENKPQFVSHDRYGHRIDLAEFHPSYHELMRTAIEHGLPSLPWTYIVIWSKLYFLGSIKTNFTSSGFVRIKIEEIIALTHTDLLITRCTRNQ